jgi:hypothetical protein
MYTEPAFRPLRKIDIPRTNGASPAAAPEVAGQRQQPNAKRECQTCQYSQMKQAAAN